MWPTICALLVLHGRRVSDLPGQRLLWERPLDAPLCSLQPSHILRRNYSRFLYVRRVIFCSISPRYTFSLLCFLSSHRQLCTMAFTCKLTHARTPTRNATKKPQNTQLSAVCVAFIFAHHFQKLWKHEKRGILLGKLCWTPGDQEAVRRVLISGNKRESARKRLRLQLFGLEGQRGLWRPAQRFITEFMKAIKPQLPESSLHWQFMKSSARDKRRSS